MGFMDDDDIHLGNYSEIGEALRGMQDTQVGAGARQLAQLRGALGQLAAQRFGGHAPVSKQMRSPYKDSTQISIKATGTFTPANWNASALPQISGLTRVYKSFKPTKAILNEIVKVTFTNSSGSAVRVASLTQGDDLVLVSAFSGADNCFPNAPSESNGIAGPSFANVSLGNGISWPTINGGIDMTVAFAIEDTVLYQVDPPAGFTVDDITSVEVRCRFGLFGPSLR